MAVERWTQEAVKDFRSWHETLIRVLYGKDEQLVRQLQRDREKFLARITPRK